MLLTIIAFLVIFSVVIFVHELGHFYFARHAGVRVEEFGFGLPPRLWGKRRGDTIYSLNLIPFGGFVKLYGEGDEFLKDKLAFSSKTPLAKLAVVVGGVLMNVVFGFLVMMIGFWCAMPPLVTPVEQYVKDATKIESRTVIAGVVDKSAATLAGLLPGDYLVTVDGKKFTLPEEFKNYIQSRGNSAIEFIVQRDKLEQTITVTPIRNQTGDLEVGILLDRSVDQVHYIWWQVPWLALQETIKVLWLILVSIMGLIYKLFTTASLPAEISGPVGIAKITADMVRLGWFRVVQFVIFLSLNLGIVNLVPFPGLDGGRLIFVLMEMIRRGKKVPGHIENTVNTIGFLLLLVLIAVVTYKDIIKLI